jgi:CubicO group peptidase (beta-lactamase class C family)
MKSLLFGLLFLPVILCSQDRKIKIEQLMKAAGIPGLSLTYVKQGKIQEWYNLGVRSVDSKEAVDSGTVFNAASLSKCVFAYAVMKLVDSGKLSLDTPLYKYLEYPDLSHDERYKKITARMTLSHTSGLPNWRNGPQLNFRYNPGERYSYSGEGFVLLSKVGGKNYGQTDRRLDPGKCVWSLKDE